MANGAMGNTHPADISLSAVTPYLITKYAQGTAVAVTEVGDPSKQATEVSMDGIPIPEPLPTPRVVDEEE